MSEGKESAAEFYDGLIESYDEDYDTPVGMAEDRVLSSILTARYAGGKVLDIGCGTGLALEICPTIRPGDYTGIDVSAAMVARAAAKYTEATFIQADMHTLPFEDNSFDEIISLYGPISYSLAQHDLREEILRVLRPGGSMMLMPYSQRVPTGLDIGYSTARNPAIPKTFYTSKMAQEIYGHLPNFSVQGFNFFGNRFLEYIVATLETDPDTTRLVEDYLRAEQESARLSGLPAEAARHIIILAQKPHQVV